MSARTIFLCLAAAACAGPACAHAFLDHAVPGAGATVASPPKQVALVFTEQLEAAFSGVTVTDAAGHDVEAAKAVIAGASMTVALKPLGPGTYRVTWRAVSVDTHRTDGAYRFTVRP